MTLPRTSIRQYVRMQLLGNTDAGQNVYDTRIAPFFEADLPLINILILNEDIDDQSNGYSHNRQTLKSTLHVLAIVALGSTDSPGVVMDALCEQIAAKIDRHLGGNATRCEYRSTDIQIHDEGATPAIMAVLTYDLEY